MKQIKKKQWNPPQQLTCFLEGSRDHANPIQWPESEKERKTNAIYGPKCCEQLEKFNHVGLWAKMFSALLIGQEGWCSTRCKLTWKLRGTKYGRMFFQLRPLALPTEEIGYGLLPTVTSHQQNTQFKQGGTCLQAKMAMGMLPTPNSRDFKDAQTPEKYQERKEKWAENGINIQLSLPQLVKNQMLPTPMASDCGEKVTGLENQDSLVKMTREITGKPSQLNPRFVLEMMGFPPNWTELPFLNGETNQLRPEETP
jgi:hypothetical protein